MQTLTCKVDNFGLTSTQTYQDEQYGSGFLMIAYRHLHFQGWYQVKVWIKDNLIETWNHNGTEWVMLSTGLRKNHIKGILLYHGRKKHFPIL